MFTSDDEISLNTKLKFKCKIHNDKMQYISYSSLKSTKNACKICFNKKGENSVKWKGGITPLVRNMRTKINKWKSNKMKESNFLCELTGMNGKLVVHHVENFHKLLEISVKKLGLEVKNNIRKVSFFILSPLLQTLVLVILFFLLFEQIYNQKTSKPLHKQLKIVLKMLQNLKVYHFQIIKKSLKALKNKI